MRTLGQLSFIGLTTLLSSFLVACGASPGPDGGAGATTGSGGAGTGTGGATAGVGGSGTGGTVNNAVCVPGVPTTTQFPRMTSVQYENSVEALLGFTTFSSGSYVGMTASASLNPDFEGPMNPPANTAYIKTAENIARDVMADATLKAKFITCDPAVAGCLTDTIRAFGRKAFRRPLTDDEVLRFEGLSNTTPPGTPEEIAETTLWAFLTSPSFIMITELEQGAPIPEDAARPGDIKLSSYEVAARLSFLLWGSVPDDELNAAADANALTTKAQVLAQATRMLQDRVQVGPQVARAFRKWADMDNDNSHWFSTTHAAEVFPEYTADTVPALAAETDAFFEEVALGGGSFADIFLSQVGFVNQHTAALYDLNPADYGPELEKVTFTNRPGFLTRAGFLSSYSGPEATSPILRGSYITIRMLGVDPGPPSENALTTKAPDIVYTSQRQYIEALTSPLECTGCHTKYINPPGFALENYNSVGKWQDTDPLGAPINPTTDVTFAEDNKVKVESPLQMMTELSKSSSVRRNFAEKVTAFATGRAPNPNDACDVDRLNTALSADGYTVLNLLSDLTQADSLRLRTQAN